MNCITLLEKSKKSGIINARQLSILQEFYHTFCEAVAKNNKNIAEHEPVMYRYFEEVIHEIQSPFIFEPYHAAIRTPFDYYRLGLDLFGPLVVAERSKIFHPERIQEIVYQLSKGENVILLANHQTEPDPQFISFMLEKHP
ncbi:MAG: hypothetical protein HWD61_08465 [Parachlamydiaceae bacterium]|nr:MAG: hypothetical protein HWD61_08465 [Parachlamydiaceae bacterium]